MKIDRGGANDELHVDLDPADYTANELNRLLNMIHEGNKASNGLRRVCSGDGLLGFIRFTQGYYLVLITEKEKRGSIGPHQIYSVTKTGYVYVPFGQKISSNSVEGRYKNLFFSLDFTDFYFSYSYDLTHTLQHNLTYTGEPYYNKSFAWNHYLMKPLLSSGSQASYWAHPLVHGYFAQKTLSQHGRLFQMSIIARRSRHFAGTRYLKRGVNGQGQVANDVETEQIAEDCSLGALQSCGSFTAFVQMRGSIPLFWGQEPRTLTPKPPIFLQRCDPLYAATKLHFRDLFRRFGSPVVVLNLVKKKEKKPRESVLRTELGAAIQEINELLPPHFKIRYISWDFSRAAKSESENVITQMSALAEEALKETNFFHSGRHLYANKVIRDNLFQHIVSDGYTNDTGRIQHGVLRSNCIDSLDRTNAAQFVTGKVVMGYQLYAMGIISSPELDWDEKIAEVLTYLYQDMGNSLALQYGGSELAHTMKSYKEKNKSLGNKPRDLLTSFRRYYSNSFMDNEKQDKINLFLGNYKPWQETTELWDLETDYYLHMKDPSYSETMML
jgi:phosphatidylinositol 3,5-bisphosphate 5-phosphatase